MMQAWLRSVARGRSSAQDLPYGEAVQAAVQVVERRASDAQIGALLVALRLKSETPEELRAFVDVLRDRCLRLPLDPALAARSVDVALTAEGRESFIAGVAANILCALGGLPLFMHGALPLPPRRGLSNHEILADAGLAPAASPAEAAEDLARFNIAFADDEMLCPPLAGLRPLRAELGLRTVLHLAARMSNAAGSRQVLLGVPHPAALQRLRSLGAGAGFERLVAVLGNEGGADLPTHKPASVLVFESGEARRPPCARPATSPRSAAAWPWCCRARTTPRWTPSARLCSSTRPAASGSSAGR
jgi:anthranilate phosphoribosyltransferase